MAVVVRQEGENYYKVHRVLMPDGSQFDFYEKRDTVETAGQAQNELDVSPTDSISNTKVPQNDTGVNNIISESCEDNAQNSILQSSKNAKNSSETNNSHSYSISEAEQKILDTPDSQLTPEQRAVKDNIIERQSPVLRSNVNNDIINNDNKTNTVRGENNGGANTELLAGGKISAVGGSGNGIRQQSENSRALSDRLERFSRPSKHSNKSV